MSFDASDLVGGLLVLFMAAMWVAGTFILSRYDGWYKLQQRFTTTPLPNIETLNMKSAKMEWIRFRNTLSISERPDGLYLRPMPLFRFGHPPLLIPWREIKRRHEDGLFLRYVVLTLGSKERVELKITEGLAQELKADRELETRNEEPETRM